MVMKSDSTKPGAVLTPIRYPHPSDTDRLVEALIDVVKALSRIERTLAVLEPAIRAARTE
jgi:hypothetical protein